MRILAIVAQVPGAEERLKVAEGGVDLGASKLVLDTMDEYGVEEALRLREAGAGGDTAVEVIVLGVGPSRVEAALRNALALGADRAVLVDSGAIDLARDVVATSKVIAEVAKRERADLVLCGAQQADSDSQALGAAVAERLGWAQATWVTALTCEGRTLAGRHDVDDGQQDFRLPLPAVVTAQQGLNEPRYPTLPNIMKARKKELRMEVLAGFDVAPQVRLVKQELQHRERLHRLIPGSDAKAAADELLRALREDAKVLA
ncbi:electron transfer flavoprotein beta subunit [Bryocella elongata]|uniref:Electron transfer flavoprotein subunit beta n=1 Tax=Bryocella elongata TaxID=863522 RepID=A0A1H5XYE1_9BACT|nr:electron transfer flavoprotein subunit beta/FixA family protein [Bryocella elongata]SEG16673.1 electron transfer flavoprotein beta subunit [Bryocella elongata]